MTRETSNRRRNLALGVGALLIAGVLLGRRSLTGRAAGDSGGGGGCEGKDYRAEQTETGTVRQAEGTAIDPGQVLAGAQAAISIIKMIRTYAKYGELQITNGMILDKINAVQASIVQLNTKTNEISNGQKLINANIFKADTIRIIASIDNLFSHYTFLRNNNKTAELTTFYDNLLKGVADGYATLNLGDLDAVATLGQDGLPYLAEYYGGKGTDAAAIAATTTVGEYAASLQLRLAEGFYMLALAKRAQGTDADFGPKGNVVALNETRLSNLTETFLAANDRMNLLFVDGRRAARQAAISNCYTDKCFGFGCQYRWSFDDSLGTKHLGRESGDDPVAQSNCESERVRFSYEMLSIVGIDTMKALLAAQPTFAHWSDAEDAADGGAPSAPTIHVTQAKYGTADVTPFLVSASDNHDVVSYTVDSKKLGDAQAGVAKAFSVTHKCGVSPTAQTASIEAEANGKSLTLRCIPPVDVDALVGTWKSDQADRVQLTAQVTKIDADTVNYARSDGLACKLLRNADPTRLDVSTDSLFYATGVRQVTLGRDARQKVETMTFVSASANTRYRFVP